MSEQCRLCGTPVRVADAAHVMLNAPETGVRDCYVCPGCFEDAVAPLFEGEGGRDDPSDDGPVRRDDDLATPE